MAFRNEVYLSGRIAGDIRQFGNGPFRFQISQGGGVKKTRLANDSRKITTTSQSGLRRLDLSKLFEQ